MPRRCVGGTASLGSRKAQGGLKVPPKALPPSAIRIKEAGLGLSLRDLERRSAVAQSSEGQARVAGLKQDLAKWREQLAGLEAGAGFDTQSSLISAWIKEGERLLDRIQTGAA